MTDKLQSADLRQFTGTERYYALGVPFSDVVFTDGVEYLARVGGAQWLVVAIAAHLTVRRSLREHGIVFWKLAKRAPEATAAVLTAVPDIDLPALVEQVIPYTDFPLDEVEIWAQWDGEVWTLYLPSEH